MFIMYMVVNGWQKVSSSSQQKIETREQEHLLYDTISLTIALFEALCHMWLDCCNTAAARRHR